MGYGGPFSFLWMADASAQLTLVKDGKAVSRIALSEKSEINRQAADLLQDFVQRISGASLPIVEGKAKSGDVVIGGKSAEAGEDGFTLVPNRTSCGLRVEETKARSMAW